MDIPSLDRQIADRLRLATEMPTQTDDLYHYTSSVVALDSILLQRQIQLGLFETTNDPRESRPRYPNISVAHGVDANDVQSVWEEADHYLRRSTKVACFTLDYALPDSALEVNRLRGYAHPALWAHYGTGHSGVCLKFSRAALGQRMRDELRGRGALFEGPVRYASESWRGNANARGFDLEQMDEFGVDAVVTAFIQRHHEELFFSKHADWSSEREYRWVLVEPDPLPVYVSFADALTGVVLGASFPQERLRAVHRLAAGLGDISVIQLAIQNGGIIAMPSAAPPVTPRSYQRKGTLSERYEALEKAAATAAGAKARAETSLAPLMPKLNEIVQRLAAQVGLLQDVHVDVFGRALAVPPADRARQPGVPTYESDLDTGGLLVITAESPAVEFVAGVALQALAGDRVRVHGVLSTRDLASTDPEVEIWRLRQEIDSDEEVVQSLLDELAQEMLLQLPAALDGFRELRRRRQRLSSESG